MRATTRTARCYAQEMAARSGPHRSTAELAVPIAVAKSIERAEFYGDKTVYVDFSEAGFLARGVVLTINGTNYFGRITNEPNSPILLGSASLAAWDARLEAQKKVNPAAGAEAKKEDDIRRIERNRKYGHNGAYLRPRSFVCATAAQALRMGAIVRVRQRIRTRALEDCIARGRRTKSIVGVLVGRRWPDESQDEGRPERRIHVCR